MRIIKNVLIGVGAFFTLIFFVGFCGAMKGVSEAPPIQPAAPLETVEVQSKALAEEMRANEIATLDRYKNKIVRVTGDVEDISEDFGGDPVVYLSGTSDWNRVALTGFSRSLAGSLSKGVNITAGCKNIREIGGSVFLDCWD